MLCNNGLCEKDIYISENNIKSDIKYILCEDCLNKYNLRIKTLEIITCG